MSANAEVIAQEIAEEKAGVEEEVEVEVEVDMKETDYTESLYQSLGGENTLRRLVDAFYPKVYADPNLSPLFEGDMEAIKQKQFQFLSQFTGGPTLYADQHGHPMMRYRHMKFPVTPERARAWLHCMKEAMDEIGLSGYARAYFYERLEQLAHHMVNTESPHSSV